MPLKASWGHLEALYAADREHAVTKFRKQYIKTVNDSRERNGEPLLTEDEEITIEDMKTAPSEEDVERCVSENFQKVFPLCLDFYIGGQRQYGAADRRWCWQNSHG